VIVREEMDLGRPSAGKHSRLGQLMIVREEMDLGRPSAGKDSRLGQSESVREERWQIPL